MSWTKNVRRHHPRSPLPAAATLCVVCLWNVSEELVMGKFPFFILVSCHLTNLFTCLLLPHFSPRFICVHCIPCILCETFLCEAFLELFIIIILIISSRGFPAVLFIFWVILYIPIRNCISYLLYIFLKRNIYISWMKLIRISFVIAIYSSSLSHFLVCLFSLDIDAE